MVTLMSDITNPDIEGLLHATGNISVEKVRKMSDEQLCRAFWMCHGGLKKLSDGC